VSADSLPGVSIRRLSPDDSFAALTDLVHRAYAPLGAAGQNFTAVDQSEETTRDRCGRGTTFVAEEDGRIVGTLTVAGPEATRGYAPFATPTSWHLEQFAVDPALQGKGVGRALVSHAEQFARERAARTMLGDTSERATHLIALYERADYRVVGHLQWPGKTYRSVVMEKHLPPMPVAEFLFPGPGRDRLVAAVLAGTKTASTALLDECVLRGETLPKAGDRALVVDSAGRFVALIETTHAQVRRLGDVDLAFALDEGEGFESVAQWRDAHVRAFASPPMLAALGATARPIGDDTLVVCERFRLVERL